MQAQEGPYEADFSDPDHIRLATDYAVAQINFYDMAPDPEIVESHIENKYVVDQFFFARPLRFNAYDPANVLELVGKVLAMDAATIDPEVVCLRCDLLPDMDEVAAELAKYVPRERQPRLVRIDDFYEHILLGAMFFCQEKLEG